MEEIIELNETEAFELTNIPVLDEVHVVLIIQELYKKGYKKVTLRTEKLGGFIAEGFIITPF